MIRRFFRHLWESIKSLKRNGWMTVAATGIVTITLTLLAIFASVILNAAKLTRDIENNVRITVYLQVDTHDNSEVITVEGQERSNENFHKIYDQLQGLSNVKSVTFSDKNEQLNKLIETMGDDWNLYSGDANPLYDAYIVDATSPSEVVAVSEAAKTIEGVTEVNYGGANTQRLLSLTNLIQTWGLIGVGLLFFIAIFLISNTIRITIISRSREIQIMRLVGAKSSYIRGPFLFEGAWIGLIGAILPSLLVYFVYDMSYRQFNPGLVGQNLSMITPDLFIPIMIGSLFVLGMIIGSIGARISMRRYLKV
ncbi:Cell division protein FtsX [Streptococcus sp. DD10]|uniref:permease-like cell division protein FtsX n=1 Tax=Streptococcus sp. DD10 TaxID=1777878 RepID=UPI0007929FFA|nr:permease-like cell division protein FtsX [Streptococcus sp. DD10]KXT77076.1 Cell division protein FtsX [Streptococcus sp. DD10]